jgi:hypothetical protein
MSKFEIRSPILLTAALALAPALAFAGDPKNSAATTTTTTTTAPPGSSASTTPPQGSANSSAQGTDQSGVLSPSTPPDMQQADPTRMNPSGMPPSGMNPSGNVDAPIDSAQVQKVFGMDVALIDLKALNRDQVKQMQQRLQERGFYRGKIDGAMGPQTRNALTGLMAQQYSLNQRLANQGQITQQFATSIGVDTNGRSPVTGVDTQNQPAQNQPAKQPPPQYPAAPTTPNQ